ncbi:MAG: ATP-dependent endonuclease [Nitrospirae bacterium]|nr:MAG: ATP-dependent endonuclease [Nitrospirota bacterium]
MKLHRAQIKNFRLLSDVELIFENQTTLIVGRNNSGKTSLSEVIRRFTSDKSVSFRIQDFSAECYMDFCKALEASNEGKEEQEVRALLPYIELRLFFKYNPSQPDFGPLSEFIIDLDMKCQEALVVMRFALEDGAIDRLFHGHTTEELTDINRAAFFRDLGERIPKLYTINVWGEDPNDVENRKNSSQAAVKSLLNTGFINAQRGLDDITTRESNVLTKILESLLSMASMETADAEEREIATQLEEAVRAIQLNIDGDFRNQLVRLLPTLEAFGYPGLGGPELTTETILDVQRLLTDHTKVRYKGHSGVLLPETYNGLGMRNLIFILLQIISFYREYRAQPQAAGVQLIFIEEPEAHLHPQMQEVFIRQVGAIVDRLNKEHKQEPPWPVQIIVSTHSSHIANEASFEAVRYFLPVPANKEATVWKTKIKDLRKGLANTPEDKKFLHQYLTLTRCDLFFADKAVLIEGTSERLLLPAIVQKLDADAYPNSTQLRSQYMTVMEVGGAYAHKFLDLLEFLELQSLIITDLDPVEKVGGKKCLVHQAKATSNACIKHWFNDSECIPTDLITKSEETRIKGRLRIAYQCPEVVNGPCGRTLEDAFILANAGKFSLISTSREELEQDARDNAEENKKSEFALKYAIDDLEWKTPKYIAEGLKWLATNYVAPPELPQNLEDPSACDPDKMAPDTHE